MPFCKKHIAPISSQRRWSKTRYRVQQYYVEDSHPAIVDPDEFDAVQAEIERRKSLGNIGRCGSPFSGKIVCGECGGWYGKKVWGSYKADKSYRHEIYQCNDKYKHKGNGGKQCQTPFVTEDEVKDCFLTAFNTLMANRDNLIEDCRLAQTVLCDTAAIDGELAELRREIEVVTELTRKAIYENARTTVDQTEWSERNNSYLERHRKATEQTLELETAKRERLAKSKTLDIFIRDIESRPLAITEFDEGLWLAVIDRVTVATDGTMTFTFRNGTEITA